MIEPYYRDTFGQLYLGHILDISKTMPDESIDCVITSPPYWGLRDYGLDPIIWDGDENCEHEWKQETTKRPNQSGGKGHLQDCNVGSFVVNYNRRETKSNFCLKCGAWRGSLGLEPDFNLYLKHLLQIFDEIKRVLKKTGTCWVNIGDSYGGSGMGMSYAGQSKGPNSCIPDKLLAAMPKVGHCRGEYSKSLCGIPERFAIAMTDRGWIRRNTIIWYKRNCMPSSRKDGFTIDFEYVYFFVKNNKTQYWVNQKTGLLIDKQPIGTKGIEGVDWEYRICPNCGGSGKTDDGKECKRCKGTGKYRYNFWSGRDYWFERQFEEHKTSSNGYVPYELAVGKSWHSHSADKSEGGSQKRVRCQHPLGRNMRCVWDITTQPFKDAHFAVFPEKLVEPMIKAGCPEFICKKCGKAREKIFKTDYIQHRKQGKWMERSMDKKGYARSEKMFKYGIATRRDIPIGYTSCQCPSPEYESGIVFDPFCGSGTSCVKAKDLGRQYTGIDCKSQYLGMSIQRLKAIPENMFKPVTNHK